MQTINVPHLTTSLTGPLVKLEQDLLDQQVGIETWLRQQWRLTPPPFYSSVDLRNAGYKLAQVDTNLFPAGFNNLNPEFIPLAIQAVQSAAERLCPETVKFLIIPESHSRNLFYMESLATLHEIITKAGFAVRIGSLSEDIKAPTVLELPSGRHINLEPIIRQDNKIGVGDYFPCCILLNNDLSSGVPALLQDLDQHIMPPTELGWAKRLKSSHFQHFANVTNEFAREFSLDPWTIAPLFRYCGEINFMTREGEECLVRNATTLLNAIKAKYQEYNIQDQPFLVVKADAGTYGMAVMMIKDPQELTQLNRKQRTKMAAIKGGQSVSRVIIQEGVYTFETVGKEGAVAEPVVYMIGCHVIGGFYRVHAGRGIDENLNAPGMNFEPLAFAEAGIDPYANNHHTANRFYSYGVIARLAALAAAREMKESQNER
jgi:glutamate--cysteine ligase